MQKDTSALAAISLKFTEKTIQDILRKTSNTIDVEVENWQVTAGAPENCNYLSTIYRVTVTGAVDIKKESKNVKVQVIAKGLPHNECYKKSFRSLEFFKNEIAFYTEVIPVLEKFAKSKGQGHLLHIPRCLDYYHDGENDFIVLEDITIKGFGHSLEKQEIWPVNDVKLILKTLAEFHGLSLAHWHDNPSEFLEATKNLEETFFSEKCWHWYKNYYTNINTIVKSSIAKVNPSHPATQLFCSISSEDLFRKCINCCKMSNSMPSVVNHGDAWAFNFMTHQLNNNEAIMLDFQLTRVASPILDISYFIYTSTDKKTRDQYFDEFLRYYYSILKGVFQKLAFNIDEVYPWDYFMKEVNEKFILGLAFAVDVLPMMLASNDDLSDMGACHGDKAINIADIWKLNVEPRDENKERIFEVILHGFERGFLS